MISLIALSSFVLVYDFLLKIRKLQFTVYSDAPLYYKLYTINYLNLAIGNKNEQVEIFLKAVANDFPEGLP